jgi:hypothetical protein
MRNQTELRLVLIDVNTTATAIYDQFYTIVLTSSAFSLICCAMNVAVLSSSKLKDPLYKFMMLISSVDFLYMVQVVVGIFLEVECLPAPYLCGGDYAQYFASWFYQASANYLTSCLAIFSILSEIFLTIQRLFLIKKLNHLKSLTWRHVSPGIAVISLLYYAPVWFSFTVVPTEVVYSYKGQNYTEWSLASTDIGNTVASSAILTSLQVFRTFLVMVVLLALNIASVFAFQKYMSKKLQAGVGKSKSSNIYQVHSKETA